MASKGMYRLENCVPDGSFDIANVSPGETLSRQFSFRVNSDVAFDGVLNAGGTLGSKTNPNDILRGTDGVLVDENGKELLQVNTWQIQYNVQNSDWNEAGNPQTMAVTQNYTVTLTFTETVIRDSDILMKVREAARGCRSLTFTGVLDRKRAC